MRECPTCRTTYTDDSLRFCLTDGTALTESNDSEATVVNRIPVPGAETVMMNPPHDQLRIDISQPPSHAGQSAYQTPPPSSSPSSSSGGGMSTLLKVLTGVLLLGLLLLILAGVGGLVYYRMSGGETVANTNTNTNTRQSATPTPARSDKDELQDQIANLQKQLDEQKKTGKTGNSDVDIDMPEISATYTTARVNSPGDGFLALRNLPSSEIGERIMKIPHGATIQVGGCGPYITPVKLRGRWCQATYEGNSGWVFDGYLIYSK